MKANFVDIDRLSRLIDKGDWAPLQEDLNQRDRSFYGIQPLTLAASKDQLQIFKMLLESGYGIENVGADKSLHFLIARDAPGENLAKYLLSIKVQPDLKAVFTAAEKGKVRLLTAYADNGIDLTDSALVQDGKTLLEASVHGGTEVVKFLLAKGLRYEPNLLVEAAQLDNMELVNSFVTEFGAQPNYIGKSGLSAIHAVCLGVNVGMLEFLLKHGGDINLQTNFRGQACTPLHFACMPSSHNKIPIVEYLITNGVNLDPEIIKSALEFADTKFRKQLKSLFEKKTKSGAKKR